MGWLILKGVHGGGSGRGWRDQRRGKRVVRVGVESGSRQRAELGEVITLTRRSRRCSSGERESAECRRLEGADEAAHVRPSLALAGLAFPVCSPLRGQGAV